MAKIKEAVIPVEDQNTISGKIYFFREQKVMLDKDLAELYGVETRVLNQSVKRNMQRFPADFMFQLNDEEFKDWTSQIVISGTQKMGIRRKPFAFTEQGVAMLSGIINSPKAIDMNIAIMRAFVAMRKLNTGNKELAAQIQLLFERVGEHDVQLGSIYDAMENLMDDKATAKKWEERNRIGFKH